MTNRPVGWRCPFILLLCVGLGGGLACGSELSGLASLARSILGADQGVYVEAADGTLLLAQAATVPVHPASVSKVPTTLALLRKLGPEYRFITTFAASGPVHNGTVDGDLLVEGGGDPYFVDENALLVAQRLNESGVHRVVGVLRPRGPLLFNWQQDGAAGQLQRALSGQVSVSAWTLVQSLSPALQSPPALQFDGATARMPPRAQSTGSTAPLLVHQSQPLISLIKSLNDYSNNVFKPLADAAGGAVAVESLARESVPESMRSEITLGDGAGTDARNRLSPRAAVKLLRALERELSLSNHTLVDVLPVSGVDAGTLHDRLNGPAETGRIVGKTGTFGDYGASALIGAISTSDRGTVYFAILNHGVPVSVARTRQDQFLRALLAQLNTLPWSYQPDLRPAVARAQALLVDTSAH
ncbi:MAG TPA: D-alanyl-D-alanine carboxypeptidase [Steroidobacteraceae bacterium]|nr:D-alanyl-D-alanine carboxypeptidase [Steroidobacteraceae bacterium]